MPAQWGELTDRNPTPCHDEVFALVEPAHDGAAVVSQLPLCDLLDDGERSLGEIAEWGPAEDWADWAVDAEG